MGDIMSVFSELHMEMQEDDSGMMECYMAHETSRCADAVDEVANFIRSGVISEEDAITAIREAQYEPTRFS
jgi:hypothetical protein